MPSVSGTGSGTSDPRVTEVRVGVANFAVAADGTRLSTVGLGSCVAIALHEPLARMGALAHILLPDVALSRDSGNPGKFPATVVPLLVAELRRQGARGPLTARIAGGASMFAQLIPVGGINMGERNVAATRRALDAAGIPIVAHDTGGDFGRSVHFDVGDGRLVVKSLTRGERVL